MKNIYILLLLISLNLNSNSTPVDSIKDIIWFRKLHPAMQYYLFERNQYRIVKEDDINSLLPLNEIDLRFFNDIYELSFLKDFNSIEKLLLPPSVNDFTSLSELRFNNLKYLDLSFTNIKEVDLDYLNAKNLETLNLSGTEISNYNFLEKFPHLIELYILPNQLSSFRINEIVEKYPDLKINYPDVTHFHSSKSISNQVKDYIYFFDSTYGVFSKLPAEFTIKLEVNSEGRINQVDLICKKKNTTQVENLLYKIVLTKSIDNEEKQLLIPIKKN
ncbi:MAG: hypothetical protein CVT95_06070 [Bacteroidetes bacterium HGW-Bacteroidetes-12]|nr:MAG: hypothetical protein CVT95_06070 [Bacteroidetes bacterium HGW-Bacteroidetes-12]